jgi:hypothetical protein
VYLLSGGLLPVVFDGFGNIVKHSSVPLTPNSPKCQDEQIVESFLVIAL